jgi:hypothetical protein
MSIRKCLSCLICIALLLNFVDAALPQFEIYLLDGRCPVPAGAVKLIIILLLLLGLTILRVRFEPEHDTFIYISLLAAYFAFEVIYLSQFYAASYVVFSFENYYAYLWLIPLFFMVRPSMPDKFWRVALPCMAIILTSIGFLQGYTNTPVVAVTSIDGHFFIRSYTFFGSVRAFSLFGNAGSFGNFLCIASAFGLFTLLRKGSIMRKCLYLPLLGFVIIVTFMTLSRSVYYEFALTLVSVWFLLKKPMPLLRYLPVIYGLSGVALAFAIPGLNAIFGRTIFGIPLLDATTQMMRLVEWQNTWQLITSSPASFLFGTGLIQSTQYASVYNGSIDNIFLAVLLHAGLIGFCLYMIIMANLWSHCLEIARRTNDIFPLSCIAVFSTWMILGVFTIQPTGFPLIFILSLVSSGIYMAKPKLVARTARSHLAPAE